MADEENTRPKTFGRRELFRRAKELVVPAAVVGAVGLIAGQAGLTPLIANKNEERGPRSADVFDLYEEILQRARGGETTLTGQQAMIFNTVMDAYGALHRTHEGKDYDAFVALLGRVNALDPSSQQRVVALLLYEGAKEGADSAMLSNVYVHCPASENLLCTPRGVPSVSGNEPIDVLQILAMGLNVGNPQFDLKGLGREGLQTMMENVEKVEERVQQKQEQQERQNTPDGEDQNSRPRRNGDYSRMA